MTVIFCILLVIAGFIMIWMYTRIIALERVFKEERRALLIIGTAFPKYLSLYYETKSLMYHGYPSNKIIEILKQNKNGASTMTVANAQSRWKIDRQKGERNE